MFNTEDTHLIIKLSDSLKKIEKYQEIFMNKTDKSALSDLKITAELVRKRVVEIIYSAKGDIS